MTFYMRVTSKIAPHTYYNITTIFMFIYSNEKRIKTIRPLLVLYHIWYIIAFVLHRRGVV